MGDIGDMWQQYKQQRKEHKEKVFVEYVPKHFEKLSEKYKVEKLTSYHWRINNFDYWPTTGLFIHKFTKKQKRGIKNLLIALEKDISFT